MGKELWLRISVTAKRIEKNKKKSGRTGGASKRRCAKKKEHPVSQGRRTKLSAHEVSGYGKNSCHMSEVTTQEKRMWGRKTWLGQGVTVRVKEGGGNGGKELEGGSKAA